MKSKILFLIFFITSYGFSQSVNDFMAVIIPMKYDFQLSENQYRLQTITKINLQKAGFKAFVLEDRFYVLGEIGAGFAVTNGYKETTFLWAPGIGYANENFDISLRYEDYKKFNTNQIALRLAYGFKL